MNHPLFIFEHSLEVALHNAKILEDHHFDLDSIITRQHPSPISYGSEFCPASELYKLLQHHPHWYHLKTILDNGATFP
jgi:hypothetical protein